VQRKPVVGPHSHNMPLNQLFHTQLASFFPSCAGTLSHTLRKKKGMTHRPGAGSCDRRRPAYRRQANCLVFWSSVQRVCQPRACFRLGVAPLSTAGRAGMALAMIAGIMFHRHSYRPGCLCRKSSSAQRRMRCLTRGFPDGDAYPRLAAIGCYNRCVHGLFVMPS